MSRVWWRMLIVLTLVPAAAGPAQAQEEAGMEIGRAAVGGALGVVGGVGITLAAIVARARFKSEYLDSADDLIHWQSVPMIAAPAVGVVFGLASEEALIGSIAGSTAGLLVGAGVGAGLAWMLSTSQEWPWAGGVIGGGIGLSLGGLAGGLLAWSRDEDPEMEFPRTLRVNISVPVR